MFRRFNTFGLIIYKKSTKVKFYYFVTDPYYTRVIIRYISPSIIGIWRCYDY